MLCSVGLTKVVEAGLKKVFNILSPLCSSQGFADFSQFKAASNGSTLAPMTDKSASSAGSAGDLLDVFSPATANTSLSLNLNANTQVSMSAAMNMPIVSTGESALIK